VRWFSNNYRSKNPKLLNVVRNWVMKNDPKIYPTIYEVLATGLVEITSPIPKISCPTLVITADEDFGNGPEMAYAIAKEIPKSQVLILKGLRHMALAEAPDIVNKPIEKFLNEVTKT
jgi:pimeloyl-ACP methyl ester carboxylesterase